MRIFIDDREDNNRISSAVNYYVNEKFGYGKNLFVSHMKFGDYGFSENGIYVIFEYKTVDDFIHSLSDYRVFNQALNQSNNYDYHFVIIVGSDDEKDKVLKKNCVFSGNYVDDNQYYGAIASLVNFTSVIQVPTENLSFQVMLQIAKKCCDEKPIIKRYPKSRGSPALRLLVGTINGVGYKKAERICSTLNLRTIEDVFSLNVEKLVKVKGIGKKSAEGLLEQIRGEFS